MCLVMSLKKKVKYLDLFFKINLSKEQKLSNSPKSNVFKFYHICLFQLKMYCVDNPLSLNSSTVRRKKEYLASEQHLLPRKNMAGCLPRNAAQGIFVWIFGLDLVYFYKAIAKFWLQTLTPGTGLDIENIWAPGAFWLLPFKASLKMSSH